MTLTQPRFLPLPTDPASLSPVRSTGEQMKHYVEALKAKINAGPTAPSIDTRQGMRAARRASSGLYTKPHPDGVRSFRRSERAQELAARELMAKAGLPLPEPRQKATKKGATHLREGLNAKQQAAQPPREHVPAGPSSKAVARREGIRAWARAQGLIVHDPR